MKKLRWIFILICILVLILTGCRNKNLDSENVNLKLAIEGKGKITPAQGTHTIEKNAVVDIKAEPAKEWKFSHWEGEVANNNKKDTQILLDSNRDIKVIFVKDNKTNISKMNVNYLIEVGDDYQSVNIEVNIAGLNKEIVKMGRIRKSYEIVSSDDTIIDKRQNYWKMKVGNDNRINVKYKVDLESYNLLTKTFFYTAGKIFAAPLKKNSEEEILNYDIKPEVKFNLPDTWEIYSTYLKSGKNVYRAENMYELRRGTMATGVFRWKKEAKYYGIKTVFIVPKSPETNFRVWGLTPDYALSHQYDLSIPEDAEKICKRAAFAIKNFSKRWNVHKPNRIIISSFDPKVPTRWGLNQYEKPWREQLEHHFGQFYIGRTTNTPLSQVGPFNQYFDSKMYAKYRDDKRFLGKIYAMFLTYERGMKERLKGGIEEIKEENYSNLSRDIIYKRIVNYGYHSIVTSYLDNKIKEETNNKKSLDDIFKYVLSKYKYENVNRKEFIEVIKKVTGINFKNFFENHVFGDYEIPVAKYMKKYKDEFNLQVEFMRRNREIPPILYYAYLELAGNKGIPEYYLFSKPGDPISAWAPTNKVFSKLLKELYSDNYVSKKDFIKCLNKYTDNTSNDFFEFYSKHAINPPSIKALNLYIDGKYNKVLNKLIYAKKSYEYLKKINIEDPSLQNKIKELNKLVDRGKIKFNKDKMEDAKNYLNNGIKLINEIRNLDKDNDNLPYVMEVSYNGNNKKSPKSISEIKIDGFTEDWMNIKTKSAKRKEGIFEDIKAFIGEKYLYLNIKSSKPFYSLKNSEFKFEFDFDQDWGGESEDRYAFQLGGRSCPIDESVENNYDKRDYVYVGDKNIEMKIPLETLNILNFPEEVSLRIYSRGNLKGREMEEDWDKFWGLGQIDNIEL